MPGATSDFAPYEPLPRRPNSLINLTSKVSASTDTHLHRVPTPRPLMWFQNCDDFGSERL
ncbi:hypothetical protein [Chlorogloea sp. CCALA 695]|uniref:hypothetical protein n=1 Tax=Chlorogloea sp. CCALA 695 TaxID=2107693 RepID=UPI0011B20697|nr:hypothetical protein [Chlorogloea sp. CCALA 695]